MRSTYFKHFFASAALAVLSFLILGMAFTVLSRNFLLGERREGMEVNADEISRAVSAYADGDALANWELRMMITTNARSTGNSVLIVDRTGTIISCSDETLFCPHIGKTLDAATMQMLSAGLLNNTLTNLGGLYGVMHYIITEPVMERGTREILGYTLVGYDSSRVLDTWDAFFSIFLLVTISVLGLMVIMTLVTTRQQVKPINDMAAAARKFAHGDFSARIEDRGRDDEIGALTASFNLMAESLEKSEKQRREFIGNVSHELKTPMTTISGFADGILDGTIPPEKARPYLETISSETKRLNRMVRSMLDLSRIQEVDTATLLKKTFDISEVLMRTLLSLEGKINDKKLEVDVSLPEEHFIVKGDEDSITQVVYNLLDNAIKFSHKGSEIALSLWKQDNKAYVSIKNRGDTIPADQLGFIFDRFHKTDRSRSQDRDGVGLGLYIVKTILGNHNEDISVTSGEGVTEFVFTLTPQKKA